MQLNRKVALNTPCDPVYLTREERREPIVISDAVTPDARKFSFLFGVLQDDCA